MVKKPVSVRTEKLQFEKGVSGEVKKLCKELVKLFALQGWTIKVKAKSQLEVDVVFGNEDMEVGAYTHPDVIYKRGVVVYSKDSDEVVNNLIHEFAHIWFEDTVYPIMFPYLSTTLDEETFAEFKSSIIHPIEERICQSLADMVVSLKCPVTKVVKKKEVKKDE